MTVSVSVVKKRLDRYASVIELLKGDKESDKKRFYDVLEHIEKARRIQRNYITYLKTKRARPKVSIPYLEACIKWLKEKGYLDEKKGKKRRILLFLTDNGREALQRLDDYFFAPLENPELRIKLELQEEKEVVATLTGDPDNITKTAILSNSFIRDKILELSAALCSSLGKVSLNIDLSPANEGAAVVSLLKVLWSFYWQTLTKYKLGLLGPLYIDMHLTHEEDKKTYTEFWKEHLEKFLRFDGMESMHDLFKGEKSWTVKRPLFPLLPQELENLLPIYTKDEEVKRWIEKRLEKDPDWFMPHFFWVKLGLKQSPERKELDSVDDVSPPIFHEITSPKLPREYANFDSMISHVVRKGDEESVKVLCMWIVGVSDWRTPDFYESWRILRREHEAKIGEDPKFRDTAKILDAALLEYILADRNPNVDLHSAFNDYLVSEDVEMVIRKIKGGRYGMVYARKRRETTRPEVGNLYGERGKAWQRFLKKYYPNIEKSSRDDWLLKISKKILEEFAQYWKKEYWEEKESAEKKSTRT